MEDAERGTEQWECGWRWDGKSVEEKCGREEESRVEEKEITGCDPDLETWRAQPAPQGAPELVRLIPLRAKMERPLQSSLHQSLLGHLREGWPPKMLRGRGHLLKIP